jgi:hypothetical protein
MAAATGVSEATVRRIWHKHRLKPHLVRTFKVSNDPQFAEKLEAVVGLYLNPPEHALVLCVDEKSQIQAPDRTQPGFADQEEALRNHDARLQAQWDGNAIRGAEHFGWNSNQHVRRPSSASGMVKNSSA